MTNRTVHGITYADDYLVEIVRYNRSGKWWLEFQYDDGTTRKLPTTVNLAAHELRLARDHKRKSEWLKDRPGGTTFDRLVTNFWNQQ